ncbi:hypothetical protein KAW18_11845, partial [candidate division WOR-3 bacterium]|nr:hypothetical protein [candidate division WOR-3 bacterium]
TSPPSHLFADIGVAELALRFLERETSFTTPKKGEETSPLQKSKIFKQSFQSVKISALIMGYEGGFLPINICVFLRSSAVSLRI